MNDRPWRHQHHDYQPIDEVKIVTIPRWKESYLSGDEWRISARIQYLRKGRVVHTRTARNVETALRYADAWLLEFLEQGNYSAGREAADCDQEGCNEKATVTYELKKLYTRSEGIERPDTLNPRIVCFCKRHKRRGNCGIEDSDRNYVEVQLDESGKIIRS